MTEAKGMLPAVFQAIEALKDRTRSDIVRQGSFLSGTTGMLLALAAELARAGQIDFNRFCLYAASAYHGRKVAVEVKVVGEPEGKLQ